MHKSSSPLRHLMAASALMALLHSPVYADTVRAEVGRPLQAASELLKAGKGKEALAKVREAEAVAGLTPAEALTVNRMKAAAAQRAGDNATAISALEAVYPRVSGTEQNQIAEQLASAHAQGKNNAAAADWLKKATAGGYSSATTKQLQAYLQGASGDYNAIAKDTAATVAAAEEAGRKPAEDDLLRLADAYLRTGNNGGNISTLEKLVAYYPKKDYINAYLGRLQRKPGFSERFALDVMRLKLTQGLITKADEYFEMAQLALQADQPAEAKAIMDRGYAAKALGVGAEADRHKRLMELADKKIAEGGKSLSAGLDEAQAAKDGNQLAKIAVGLIGLNKLDTGIPLLEKAIAMGGLKRPDDAKLRLGLAQLKSGNKAKAAATLRGVSGKEGAAEIARLWLQIGGAG
ncbi:MAG: hypothetical protein KGP02_00960 [Burkholderiales bacterium]|nr:hypothetical protein [Burkholderiales bacterium]